MTGPFLLSIAVLVLVFSERELTLYAVARPCLSVVCLSVCNVRAPCTQAVQIFGNISTALGTLAIH